MINAEKEQKNQNFVRVEPTNGTFGKFLSRHEQFLRAKYVHLIGVECRLTSGRPLGKITLIELNGYSALYTDNARVRINLCRSAGVTGPIYGDTDFLHYLQADEVEVACKQLSPTRPQPTNLHQLTDTYMNMIPPELWRIIEEYEGPRSWICSIKNEWTKLSEWFGSFFTAFGSEDCDFYFRNTWLR